MTKELKAELLKGYEAEIDTFSDVLSALNNLTYKDVSGFDFVRLNRKISALKTKLDKLYNKFNDQK